MNWGSVSDYWISDIVTGLKAEKAQKDRSEISAIICCVQAQCATRQWWPIGLVPVKGNLPQKLLLFSRNQDYFQPASTQKLLCCPVIKIVSSVDQPVIKKSGSRLPPAPAWPVACIHPWLPSLSKFEGIRLVEVSRLSDLSTYKCYLSIDWQCNHDYRILLSPWKWLDTTVSRVCQILTELELNLSCLLLLVLTFIQRRLKSLGCQ